ncbi:ubiquitin-like domain-containing protein [Bacillus xiapuensis]|uniref:Ubiquitin-like domain-containing protein n=1 Tax=Bacillus xiapuensis TaxID=2014075 RepID=A0ABU6N8G1_9BACI|nr:ubiquitin-like domain-containing protein [Bacillus xiapuensis]
MKNLISRSVSKKKWPIVLASLVVFAGTFGFLLFEGSKKTVAMTLNGQERIVKTHADTVREVFDELGLEISSQDYLFPAKNSNLKDNQKIVWKQAKQVTIVKDNEKKTVWTTADTVAGLLRNQNITLKEHDQVLPKPQKSIKDKMKINIQSAFHLTYVDGGKKKRVWSTSTTVADFLKQQAIKLNTLDRVEPSLTATIKKNDEIHVIRVEKVTDVVEEPVHFAVITKKDESLANGKEKTVREGQKGLVSREFEVFYENGKEVSRELIREQKLKEKQDKIVAVGAKELDLQVSRGENETGQEFYVSTTAYTADCNGCSGRTATGINLRANPNVKVVAVDPSIIPLGTKVFVEGYGYAVAADTGGAIKGYKIDLFFPSRSQAYSWGVRKVKIKVLN